MKSRVRRHFNVTRLEARLAPANIMWVGGAPDPNTMNPDPFYGNRWSVSANWSGGVPGVNDIAVFDANVVTRNGFGTPVHCYLDTSATVIGITFTDNNGKEAIGFGIDQTLTTTGTSTFAGGRIYPTYNLVPLGPHVWNNQGTINFTSTTDNVVISAVTINNNGTFNHQSGKDLVVSTAFDGALHPIFNNLAGGVVQFQTDGDWLGAPAPGNYTGKFNNFGLVRKTGGAGQSYITGEINNTGGTWDAQSGVVTLGPTNGGVFADGTFKTTTGTALDLTGFNGAATWKGNFNGTGAGTFVKSSGTMTIDPAGANLNFPNLEIYSGTINGTGTLTNSGNITVNPQSASMTLSGATISNTGTITYASSATQFFNITGGASFINEVNGVFDLQAEQVGPGAPYISASGGGSFTNRGLFKKSTGSGTSGYHFGPFINTSTGVVDVQSGALFMNGYPTLTLNGALRGNGSFAGPTIDNSSGQVLPGSSPGLLNVNNYQQSGTGDLRIDLAGTTAGTQHDQLAVFGTVSLGGTLHVALGYIPAVNDTFTIIANDSTDPVTGTFNGLAQNSIITVNGVNLQIDYAGGDGNDVTLKVTQAATALPPTVAIQVNDGSAQRSMVTSLRATFSQAVVLAGNPFTLSRSGPGGPTGNVTTNIDLSQSTANQTVAVLTFSGGLANFNSLMDGRYDLTIAASQVTGLGGQLDGNANGTGGDNFEEVGSPTSTNKLFRLFGDADGDGTVSTADFIQFRLANGGTNPIFDFDNDGAVAASDFIQFRLRFGGSI